MHLFSSASSGSGAGPAGADWGADTSGSGGRSDGSDGSDVSDVWPGGEEADKEADEDEEADEEAGEEADKEKAEEEEDKDEKSNEEEGEDDKEDEEEWKETVPANCRRECKVMASMRSISARTEGAIPESAPRRPGMVRRSTVRKYLASWSCRMMEGRLNSSSERASARARARSWALEERRASHSVAIAASCSLASRSFCLRSSLSQCAASISALVATERLEKSSRAHTSCAFSFPIAACDRSVTRRCNSSDRSCSTLRCARSETKTARTIFSFRVVASISGLSDADADADAGP
jgi:hypothetical protein